MSADEPLDFAVTYQSLFHDALKRELTPRLKQRLKELGLDLDRKLLPGYPAALWPQVMRVVAEELYPGTELFRAAQQLGQRFIDAYFGTTMGGAIALVFRTLGPMRALGRVERSLRSTNNYQRTRLTPRGPKQAELWIAEVNGVTGWFVGMIEAVAKHLALVAPRVEVTEDDGRSATFRLSWE